jgi:hypothetical protein
MSKTSLRWMRAGGWALFTCLAVFEGHGRAHGSDPAPTCLTSEGRTACGYHCVASSSQVQCSQRPEGVCVVGSGTVACWDPPPLLRGIFPIRFTRAQCVASSGQIACGYHCISNYDRVACAQTPFGACLANEDRLQCWDPSLQVIAARGELTRPASCVANYGKVGCGYNCVANYGQVRCAKTPEGFCRAERDTVFCWDPPATSLGFALDSASERACLAAASGASCGYGCLATAHASACGAVRDDVCRATESEVECGPGQDR